MVIEVKLESGAELCPENPESIAVLSPFSNTHIFSCDRREQSREEEGILE